MLYWVVDIIKKILGNYKKIFLHLWKYLRILRSQLCTMGINGQIESASSRRKKSSNARFIKRMESKSMKFIMFLIFLIATGCGIGGTVGKKLVATGGSEEKALGPWERAGKAFLPKGENRVTASVRVLEFEDGMTVSYDGSDTLTGIEEVCRRTLREETHYEVCMSLDDDPYFALLEDEAFVWHPLLFDRFTRELDCYIWNEGDKSRTKSDCESVLPYFGAQGFRCEAGLINSDKALKCSDNWAVVVNGDDDDTKTVCRVYIEDGSMENGTGRCLGAPKKRMTGAGSGGESEEQVPDVELILDMQMSSWRGYKSGQEDNRQFVEGESVQPTVPQDIPPGAVLSYQSRDKHVCTVDNDGSDGGLGTVLIGESLNPPVYCKIILTIASEGFVDRVFFDRLPILKNNDTAWADYTLDNNLLYPGERLAAGAVTSTEPSSPELEFASLDESVCTVDSATGEVLAVAEGTCDIQLYSRAEDHLDAVVDKSFAVTALTPFGDIVWSDFPVNAAVGESTTSLAKPEVQDLQGSAVVDPSMALSITRVSGDCAWNEANRIISFSTLSECEIAVSASGVRGHTEYTKTFRVTPNKGNMNLTWSGYTDMGDGANVAVFGSTPPGLVAPNTNPADLGTRYTYTATGGGCEVDATTGILTLLGASGGNVSCRIVLSAVLDNYLDGTVEQLVTINKGNQSLEVPDNPYGNVVSLVNSGQLELLNSPHGGFGNLNYRSGGDCTVAGNGNVTANSSGSSDCVIEARWAGDDNYNPSSFSRIAAIPIVSSSNSAAPTWITVPYSGNPVVGGAAVSLAAGAISNVAGGTGVVEYRSGTLEVCSVEASNGALSGVTAGNCIVQARFVGSNSQGASLWTDSPIIVIDKGIHPALVANPYGATAQVAVGEILSFDTLPVGYGAVAYTIKESPANCSVGQDGAVTGLSAGVCTVEVAFSGDDDYEAYSKADLQTITVVRGVQSLTFRDPYGAEPTLKSGETLAISSPPMGSQNGAISYQIKTGSETYCEVGAGDGIINGLGAGNCIVQARAGTMANYNASEWEDIATIVVEAGILTGIAWTPGYPQAQVGAPMVLGAVELGGLSGATVTYRVVESGESDCVFSEANPHNDALERTLTFENRGRCVVAAAVQKEDYDVWEQEHTVDVELGSLRMGSGAWGEFAGSLTVGGSSMVPQRGSGADSDAVTVAVDYSGADARGLCLQYDEQGNALTTRGACPEVETPVNLDDVRVSWSLLRGERDCRLVNYRRGEVAALRVPIERELIDDDGDPATPDVAEGAVLTKCSIVGIAEMTGRRWDKSHPVEVPLTKGRIQLSSPPRYQSVRVNPNKTIQFIVGEELVLEAGGHPQADGLVELEVNYGTQGFVAGTTNFTDVSSEKGNVCSVEGNSISTDFGKISMGSSASKGDICRLTFTLIDPVGAYEDLPGYMNFVVANDELIFANAPVLSYGNGAELKLGVTTPLTPTGLPAVDESTPPVNIVWKYEWEQFASGTTLSKEGVCQLDGRWQIPDTSRPITVDHDEDPATDPVPTGEYEMMANPNYGEITLASQAVIGDICRVKAYATAAGYNWYEGVAIVDLLVDGFDLILTSDETKPAYPEEFLVDGVVAPDTIATQDENGIDVVWSGWEAVGTDTDNAGVADDANVCSIDAATGEVQAGSAASAGDRCVVYAVASAATEGNYNEEKIVLADYIIKGRFTSLTWANFPNSATVGDSIVLGLPVAVPSTTGIIVNVASGDCRWDDSNKTLFFFDLAPCQVEVVASLSNYADMEKTFTVTPEAGGITVAGADDGARWGTYAMVTVGGGSVGAPDIGITTPPGVDKAYTTTTSDVCSVNEETGAVTGQDDDTCEVTLTLSKEGFASTDYTYIISIQTGALAEIDWGSFSGTLQVGGEDMTPATVSGEGVNGATIEYALKPGSESVCDLIDRADGTVRAKEVDVSDPPTCTIIGTAVRTGYASVTSEDISIDLSSGVLAEITWGSFFRNFAGRRDGQCPDGCFGRGSERGDHRVCPEVGK